MASKTRKKQKSLHNLLIEKGYEYSGMMVLDETEILEDVRACVQSVEKKESNRFMMVPYVDVRNELRKFVHKNHSPQYLTALDKTEELCGAENLYIFYKVINKQTNEPA